MSERLGPAGHKKIVNRRTGQLSTVTELNQPVADRFMGLSDLRKNVIIVDSDQEPERNTTQVGTDVLAFRRLELPGLIRHKRKPTHQLSSDDHNYTLAVYNEYIDDKIRNKNRKPGRWEYEDKFLFELNAAINKGLAETLLHEKVGIKNFGITYVAYGASITGVASIQLLSNHPSGLLTTLSLYYAGGVIQNALAYFNYEERSKHLGWLFPNGEYPKQPFVPGTKKEIFALPVPVHRWAAGKHFLYKSGKHMIVPAGESGSNN